MKDSSGSRDQKEDLPVDPKKGKGEKRPVL